MLTGWCKTKDTSSRVSTNGSGRPGPTSTWQFGFHFKMDSYPAQFTQLISWPGSAQFFGIDSGELVNNTSLDAYTDDGTFRGVSLTTGTYLGPAWVSCGHIGGSKDYEWFFRKPWESGFSRKFVITVGTEMSTLDAFCLFNATFSDNSDTCIKGFWFKDYRLPERELLIASQSWGPPQGKNLTYLPLNDPANAGKNLGTGADWTVTGTISSTSVEANPRLSKLKKMSLYAATRGTPPPPPAGQFWLAAAS